MMKLVCRVCGGTNDPGAQRCSTCGANFETLPEDLRPTGRGAEPAAASTVPAPPSAASSPPDWLKKFYAGVESESEPDSAVAQEFSGSDSGAAVPDLLGELFPEIKETIDQPFSRPIPAPGGSGEKTAATQNLTSDGLDAAPSAAASQEDIEEEDRKIAELETEDEFGTFETHRPQQKWDNAPIPSPPDQAPEPDGSSEESENLPEDDPTPETKTEPIEAEVRMDGKTAASEDDYADFTLHRPQRKWDDTPVNPSASASISTKKPEWKLKPVSESRFNLAPATEDGNDRTPAPKAEPPGPVAPEADYEDFSRYRPQRKWDDAGSGTGAKNEPELQNGQSRLQNGSGESAGDAAEALGEEREFVDFSVHRPQDKLEPESAVSAKAEPNRDPAISSAQSTAASDEPSLVSDFLASLAGEETDGTRGLSNETEEPDRPIEPDTTFSAVPNDTATENIVAETADDNAPTVYDSIAESWSSDSTSLNDAESLTPGVLVERGAEIENENRVSSPEPLTSRERTADEPDSFIPMPPANDSREEIPWNLFETGEMKFPTVPGVVGVSFAASVPKSTVDPSDYQQRMVASILQKVFSSERRTRGFVSPRSRTKNRLTMVLIALAAIAGVLLILSRASGGKIELPAIRPERTAASAAFHAALNAFPAGSRLEIILDYGFADEAELNAATRSLINELTGKDAFPTLIAANDSAYSIARSFFMNSDDGVALPVSYVPAALGAMTLTSGGRLEQGAAAGTILIVADATRAQRWIEDFRIFRPETKLLVIASAQAAPILRPFQRTGVLTASLLTPEEKAAYSGELSPNPARLAALWFLIALALSAILIGSATRVPLTSAITVLTEEPNPSGDALSDTADEKPNQPKEDRTEW